MIPQLGFGKAERGVWQERLRMQFSAMNEALQSRVERDGDAGKLDMRKCGRI